MLCGGDRGLARTALPLVQGALLLLRARGTPLREAGNFPAFVAGPGAAAMLLLLYDWGRAPAVLQTARALAPVVWLYILA